MNWFKPSWEKIRNGLDITADRGPSLHNLSPRSQHVLELARNQAQRRHHTFTIDTDDLMLGIIQLGQGVAFNVLTKAGVDMDSLRVEIERQAAGPSYFASRRICSAGARAALKLAQQESTTLKHPYIGTEHLLLGILREGNSAAARCLKGLQMNIDFTREEILKYLDPFPFAS